MRKGARPAMLLVAAAGAVALVAGLAARDDGSTRVADDTSVTVPSATTAPSPPTTIASPTTTVASRAMAEAVGRSEVAGSRDDEVPGLVVTNSGSATASVGGNVVSEIGGAGPPGTIITGDATAVGNVSSVRAP